MRSVDHSDGPPTSTNTDTEEALQRLLEHRRDKKQRKLLEEQRSYDKDSVEQKKHTKARVKEKGREDRKEEKDERDKCVFSKEGRTMQKHGSEQKKKRL